MISVSPFITRSNLLRNYFIDSDKIHLRREKKIMGLERVGPAHPGFRIIIKMQNIFNREF